MQSAKQEDRGIHLEEERAEGILARIKAILASPATEYASEVQTFEPEATENDGTTETQRTTERKGERVKVEKRDEGYVLVAEGDPKGYAPGEELELTEEQRRELASSEIREADEEVEKLSRQNEELVARVQELEASGDLAAEKLKEERVERELEGYLAEGVPQYLADLAKPDLLAADADKGGADRWRQVLEAAKNTVEFGERGAADGKSAMELTDDEKIRAHAGEHDLSYDEAATALVSRGEIRNN